MTRKTDRVLTFCLIAATLGCSIQNSSAQQKARRFRLKPTAAAFTNRVVAKSETVPNSIFIHGSAGNKRPFTVSRVFAQGDIPHFAQAVFNGSAVDTQCDVKTRWPDGSVQHALISFWGAPANGATPVDFVDQPDGNNTRELDSTGMLSQEFSFGAVMELAATNQPLQADARRMLQDGAFRYWLQGPICTQVIIEDRSSKLAYDLGWDKFKSFHPIFVATFYPGWKGVKVEWIGENVWANKVQDIGYSLRLTAGNPAGQLVYTKDKFTHFARTRWRKTAWSGPEPPSAVIDYSLPYMIHSGVVPNYDLTKKVSQAAVDAEWSSFLQSVPDDLSTGGQWSRYFPMTGGRADIGLFPRWYVRYLYTFDSKLEQVMRGDANASGNIPIHLREGSPGRPYLKDDSNIDGFGRPLSIESRPTYQADNAWDRNTAAQDQTGTEVGPLGNSGYTVDIAHQGSFVFLPYILTGDWYLLEELQFWGAYNVAIPPSNTYSYGRHGDWGYISHEQQTRGVAWGLRTLGHAAFATPDATPEKIYFLDKLYINIAVREGAQDIKNGVFYDPTPESPWWWGKEVISFGPNPLHYMDPQNAYTPPPGEIVNVTPDSPYQCTRTNAPWEYGYVYVVLGHLEELGLPVRPLRTTLASHLLHQFNLPGFNPYLVAAYRLPVFQAGKQFYGDWEAYVRGWNPAMLTLQQWPQLDDNNVESGYPHIATAAVSFLDGICDQGFCGDSAWNWMIKRVGYQNLLNDNPMWAIVPRSLQSAAALKTAAVNRGQLKIRSSPTPVRRGRD